MSPVEGCTHRVQHHHGTTTAYSTCRCRCDLCRAAHTRQVAGSFHDQHRGRPRLIPSLPVAAHVQWLRRLGMSMPAIAAAAGVHESTIHNLRRQETVSRRVAQNLASVTPPGIARYGLQRRLQALVASGWSIRALERRAGVKTGRFRQIACFDRAAVMLTDSAPIIVALYDELWDVSPPETTRAERHSRAYALITARRRGWVPPMAWDDIDDPTTQPAEGWERRPETSWTPRSETAEDALELLGQGCIPETICARLGKSPAAVAKALARTGHDATEFWALDGQRARQGRAA